MTIKKSIKENTQKSTKSNKKIIVESNSKFNYLSDYSICVTGLLKNFKSRDNLHYFLKDIGGKIVKTVSKKTNILITGYILEDGRNVNESRKYKDAYKNKIKIFNEEEFDEFLKKGIIIRI